jgi:hypothetical protein
MQSANRIIRLADALEAIFREGFTLTADARHYIESTLAVSGPEAVGAVLGDDTNCEKDSLVELIFFPDEAQQCRLEALLEKEDFQPTDERAVLERLFTKPQETRVYYPPAQDPLVLAVPREAAGKFIARVRIGKKLDPRLMAAIDRCLPEAAGGGSAAAPAWTAARVKVTLRNARFTATDKRVDFLSRFFEKIPSDSWDFERCLRFILDFLDALPADNDLYPALMDQKRVYFSNRQRAERLERLLAQNNMETLMLQGVRIPPISITACVNAMGLLDRISRAVFGKTEFFDPLGEPAGQPDYLVVEDIEDFIQRTS